MQFRENSGYEIDAVVAILVHEIAFARLTVACQRGSIGATCSCLKGQALDTLGAMRLARQRAHRDACHSAR